MEKMKEIVNLMMSVKIFVYYGDCKSWRGTCWIISVVGCFMDCIEEDFETLAVELMEIFLDHQDDDALANYRSSSKSHMELQVYAVHTKVST